MGAPINLFPPLSLSREEGGGGEDRETCALFHYFEKISRGVCCSIWGTHAMLMSCVHSLVCYGLFGDTTTVQFYYPLLLHLPPTCLLSFNSQVSHTHTLPPTLYTLHQLWCHNYSTFNLCFSRWGGWSEAGSCQGAAQNGRLLPREPEECVWYLHGPTQVRWLAPVLYRVEAKGFRCQVVLEALVLSYLITSVVT